jgi:23S rRNA (uracil1939-C5)-methyltransferase
VQYINKIIVLVAWYNDGMNKQSIEITIDSLSHEGQGLGHIDGKRCFVAQALPQERVRVRVYSNKRRYTMAQLEEVLEASPDRIPAQCQHFGVCGGCQLQHISQQQQIEMKQTSLLEQLQHFGQVVPEAIMPPLQAEPYGYRRKARIGVRYVNKKEKLLLGFREQNGRYLADCETCEVIHPRIKAIWLPLRDLLAGLSIFKEIPQIETAVGDDGAAIVLRHMQALSDADLQQCQQFAQTFDIHFYLQPKGPDTVHRLWPQQGPERLSYKLADQGLSLHFHPNDFTQVNAGINQQMVTQAINLLALNTNDTVLDLFCGLGNFTLPLAQKANAVVGVEGSADMVTRVLENAEHNGLSNVSAYCANLAEDCQAQPWAQQHFDKVLIDPPRSGAEAVIPLLGKIAAKRIVYVSCNPASLARDAGLLVKQGYKLQKAGVMDMFTHTQHTEAMALFVKD